mgnify:CR=1 FL=1
MIGRGGLQDRLAPFLAAAAAFLAFYPALGNDFVHWDDYSNFVENPRLGRLGLAEVRWMLSTFQLAHWQPLSWLSLGLDSLIWGQRPFGFHLTNLLLHCANAALVVLLIREVLGRGDRDPGPWPAAAGALFFALHPLRVEAVAWATQRREVLSAFFCLWTVLLYLKGRLRAALGCYLLALAAKVTVIGLPAALLTLDLYPLGRLPPGKEAFSREFFPVWTEKIPFALAALVFALIGLAAQSASPALVPLEQYGPLERLAQAFFSLAFYPAKSLVPEGLSPWYGESYRLAHPGFAAAGFALAAGLVPALWAAARTRSAPLAAAAFYFFMLFPTMGLVKSGRQIVGDRYSYLPCLPLAVAVAWAVSRLGRRAVLPVLGLAAFLGWRTSVQCGVWSDNLSLWGRALEIEPDSSFAQANMGLALLREDRPAAAAEYFERQLETLPKGPQRTFLQYVSALAHNNLGLERAAQGESAAAEREFRKALKFNPDLSRTHDNLALTLYRSGRAAEALPHFEAAVALEPGAPELRVNLGIALAKLGRRKRAEDSFREALRLDPAHEGARRALGTLAPARK